MDTLNADNIPFGEAIATQVAAQLDAGKSLGHTHRDYCGMGIEKDNAGRYLYGELYDGYITAPTIFESRASFINWLARQSTATLARLDDVNPFFHGNQVITRERILSFIQ